MNTLRALAYSLGTGLLFCGAAVVLLAAWLLFVAEVVREARRANDDAVTGWEF